MANDASRPAGGEAQTVNRWLAIPAHPLLLALYIPIWLLASNFGFFSIDEWYRAFAVYAVIVVALMAAFRFVYGDWHRAALVASVLLGLSHLYMFLRFVVFFGLEWLTLTAMILAAAGVVGVVFKIGDARRSFTAILNVTTIAMLVVPAYKLLPAYFVDTGEAERAGPSRAGLTAGLRRPAKPPAIFHYVLDGYARQDALKELYGYDNAPFVDALRELGFVVADRAAAPYSETLLSMSAIFGLDYLDKPIADILDGAESVDKNAFRYALAKRYSASRVRRVLGQLGYRVVQFETPYALMRLANPEYVMAPPRAAPHLSYFESELLGLTPFFRQYNLNHRHALLRDPVKFALESHGYDGMRGPLFVYKHILSPHPPFNLDRSGGPRRDIPAFEDGSHRTLDHPIGRRVYRDGYIEKLQYTNAALLKNLRRIVKEYPDPKIIVVHSDHGGGMFYSHEGNDHTCNRDRLSAFLAVYATDPRLSQVITPDMNVVNLYRVILNTIFGAALPVLPGKSYYVSWENPWRPVQITPDRTSMFEPACRAAVSAPISR